MSRKIVEIRKFLNANRQKNPSYTFRLFRHGVRGKEKGGIWYLEMYRGKNFSLKTRDEAEARATREEIITLVRDGKLYELQKGEKITLGQFMKEYLALSEEMVLLGEIRPNTARNDRFALRKFVETAGAELPMRHVTRETVKRFKEAYLQELGATESAMRGCNSYMRHLSTAFKWAMREERGHDGLVTKPSYVTLNPFEEETGRRGERAKFKVTSRQPDPLYPEEITAIRAAMYRKFRGFMRDANNTALTRRQRELFREYMQGVIDTDRVFLTLLLTGMRYNELIRFEERDILMPLNSIKVRSPELLEKGIKDREERHIKMHPRLRVLLNNMFPSGLKRVGLTSLVFPRWTNESSLSHRFRYFFDLAGVKKPPYATRSSFASYLVAMGEDIATIQRMMGHADLATTQKYVRAFYSIKDGSYGADFVGKMEKACRELRHAV